MYISEDNTKRIQAAASGRFLDVLLEYTNITRRGKSYKGTCPKCGDDGAFEYTPNKGRLNEGIAKCFKCNWSAISAIDFHMKLDKDYPETLRALATQFNVIIDEPEQKRLVKAKKGGKSYCQTMLAESGLTQKDIESKVFISDENKTVTMSKTFEAGTIDKYNRIVDGDDVIIHYFDLEGQTVTFEREAKGATPGKKMDYFRVRWQFPEEHKDRNGKPYKYKSPAGSGSFVYIPQRIRDIYKSNGKIERLFIQEGEKKAEKACKHGVLSVAISGIHNLGRNGHLHEDLVKLIVACDVKEVVMLFDADIYDLSRNIGIDDYVDQRSRSFFTAAKSFKEYCVQLRNSRKIFLEVYIGHIQPNENGDKGIDDLMTNTLKGQEDKVKEEIDIIVNNRDMKGEYIYLHKITSWSDARLMQLWSLNNSKDFAIRHKDVLSQLPEFRIGRYRWRFNNGEVESAQPIEHDEQYWEEVPKMDRNGDLVRTDYQFRYERCFRFLQNRGFARLRLPSLDYNYIRVEYPFVETIIHHEEIRDFVKNFTREIANEAVLEMLHRGGPQFLGPEKLSNLHILDPNFEIPSRNKQHLYFKDNFWEVTANSINVREYSSIHHHLWKEEVHQIQPKRTGKLFDVAKNDDGTFRYIITNEGKNCDFLMFLVNASNFSWRKDKNESLTITQEDINENSQHLVSKLCALGYLMLSAKDQGTAKAVVAMDGAESEIGASNGRTGKSLIGNLLQEVKQVVSINGKLKDMEGDNFLWDEVDIKTDIVVIDDLRTNFSLEFLFTNITGNWAVNYKGGRKATFPFHKSPKLYLTTNHALNGTGYSFSNRQWQIAFSDYYNDKHQPIHDFGALFFGDDWDFEQWNYVWNMLAECIQLYLILGVVEAGGERLEQRKMRQEMGESFLAWADEFFSNDDNIGTRHARKMLHDAFKVYAPEQSKWSTAQKFKTQILAYCEWKGYVLNPQAYDPVTGLPYKMNKDGKAITDDKSGGVEYFTIGNLSDHEAIAKRIAESEDLPFEEHDNETF